MRYFVQRRKPQPVRAYDDWEPIGNAWHIPAVADHEAADTGLLNAEGDPIIRDGLRVDLHRQPQQRRGVRG